MTQANTIQDQQVPISDPNAEVTEGQGSTPEVIDWQARAETAESQNLKLQNDIKSERGRRDLRMEEMADDIGGVNARLDAFARRTASGETESLPSDFAEVGQRVDQKKAVSAASREWISNYDEAEESLAAALVANGEMVVSQGIIDTLSAAWKEAVHNQSISSLYKIISQANKEARLAVEQKAQETVSESAEAAKEAKKVSDRKNGVHNLSVGTPSGSSGGKSIAQIANTTNVDDISDEEYQKYIDNA